MNAYAAGIMVLGVVTLLTSPVQGGAAREDSNVCGATCHVPMAWQGGEGVMAWKGPTTREGTLDNMKQRFAIRPDQEEAWNLFRQTVLLTAADMTPLPGPTQNTPMTIRRTDEITQAWQAFGIRQKTVLSSFRELYKKLDAAQQSVANQHLGVCELRM